MYSRRDFLGKITIGAGSAAAFLAFKNDALARVKNAVKEIEPVISAEKLARNEIFWSRIQSAFTLDRTIINFNNVDNMNIRIRHIGTTQSNIVS